MKNIKSFRSFSDEESHSYLAQAYPDGKMFGKRFDPDSIIYRHIFSLANFIKLTTGQIFTIAKNTNIDEADELLPEWEDSVFIGSKYSQLDTIEKRRAAIKRKISKTPVYNLRPVDDDNTTIENYIKTMGDIDIEIETAGKRLITSSFPTSFPIEFGIPYNQRNLLLIVIVDLGPSGLANNQFPLEFIVRFFDTEIPQATQELLDLLLGDVVPSYQNWIYEVKQ